VNGYLLSVIGTILISAFVTAITPDGKTSAVVKAITRLACILVIISPILRFLQMERSTLNAENRQEIFTESVIRTDEAFIQYYQEKRIACVKQSLQEELFDEFAVDCNVTLEWQNVQTNDGESGIEIIRIIVRLKNTIAEKEKVRMCDYLTKNYCSEVLIE
jgi:hypothetical protein